MSKRLLLAAAGAFSAIPGVAVMFRGIGTPPDSKFLFGGVLEAFGALALLIIWLNRGNLARLSLAQLTRWIITLGFIAFAALLLYLVLHGHCVVTVTGRETVYFPLWTSGKIAAMVERAGSRPAALATYGYTEVENAIELMPGVVRPITTAILLTLYQGVFTPLTLAFGLAAYGRRQ